MPYDPLKKGFSQTTLIRCDSKVEGNEIVVKLPNMKALGFPETFGLKALIWSSLSDDLGSGIYTLTPTKVEPKVDGKMEEWKDVPPLIIDKDENMPEGTDFKELYGLVKGTKFYFAVVPSKKLLCDIKGRGADVEWYLNIEVDADMNPDTGLNGKELGAGFLYSCGWDGRVWAYISGFPVYFYNDRYGISAADEVLEGLVYITPIYSTIERNKRFEVTASVLTRVKDRVPDSGWILVGPKEEVKLSEFTITGPKLDMDMSSDMISKFKGKGESYKVVRLGGPNVNPKYDAPISFVKNPQGLYAGIEVNGKKYWSTYGSVDFAVVHVKKLSQGYEITVAGITRYGTRAGLMWLVEHQSFIRQGTYVLSWFDDGDGLVELSEIGEVLAP